MTATSDVLRIALWQCEPHPEQVEENLDRLAAALDQAVAASADLLLTPEMMVTGYNIGADSARRLADPPGGPIAQRVAAEARRTGVAVLYGCAEIDADGLVYNAIRLVDTSGTSVATHRKSHLYGDLDREMVTPGAAPPPVVDLDGWRLGMLICYEVEFGELVRLLAVGGADVVCVPTANMIEFDAVQRVLLPARALESQVYVAYANYCGAERDLTYGGLSEVIAPSGEILAVADHDPALIVVDLRRDLLVESRARNPYLTDRRPELY
ncbi:carbon-nitrogen hydrolase family protein [Gordonia sp. NPDC003424]